MARLVVCCDGAWDEPVERSHIARIHEAARRVVGAETVYYDRGDGSRRARRLGRAVREAYRWLLARYRDGDRLYLFGCSRGAFTVRTLAGLIDYAGLLRPWHEGQLGAVWAGYRAGRARPERFAAERSRIERQGKRQVRVRFLGAFDTVGPRGVPLSPLDRLALRLRPRLDPRFHGTEPRGVEIARHALAIDETRSRYEPTLWTGRPGADAAPRVLQVWFPGRHADLGGLREDKRLAEVGLDWMLREAAEAGLDLFPGFSADPLFPNCLGLLHGGGPPRWAPRPIGARQRARDRGRNGSERQVLGERVHGSAIRRIQGLPREPLLTRPQPYSPDSLFPWPDPPVLDRCDARRAPCRECAIRKARLESVPRPVSIVRAGRAS